MHCIGVTIANYKNYQMVIFIISYSIVRLFLALKPGHKEAVYIQYIGTSCITYFITFSFFIPIVWDVDKVS